MDPMDERWRGFCSPALFEPKGMGLDTEREIVQAEVVELEHLVGKEEGVVRLLSFREARHRWPLLRTSFLWESMGSGDRCGGTERLGVTGHGLVCGLGARVGKKERQAIG